MIAPPQPTDVGEQPDELLLVGKIRSPTAAAAAAAAALAVIAPAVAAGVALADAAAAVCIVVVLGRVRRRGAAAGGVEEHELLLAVALAPADEALADAAPPEHRPRGAALPAPPRGRRRRRRLPARSPEAVALRRHPLQLALVVRPPPLRLHRRRSRALPLPRPELPLFQQQPAQRHPQGCRLRLILLLLLHHRLPRRRGHRPIKHRVHGHDERVRGERRDGEGETPTIILHLVLPVHSCDGGGGWSRGVLVGAAAVVAVSVLHGQRRLPLLASPRLLGLGSPPRIYSRIPSNFRVARVEPVAAAREANRLTTEGGIMAGSRARA